MENLEISKLLLESIPPVMQALRTEMREAASPNLSVPQFRVFAKLSQKATTNRELATWMGVSPPSMSRMVDTLVRRGLVRREQEAQDRREVRLTLSSKGEKIFLSFRREVQGKFAMVISKLDPKSKKALLLGLEVLREIFP